MCLASLRGLVTTLDSDKCSIFVFFLALFSLCQCRVTSDFALVLGALGVGCSCPPYLGVRTQGARCKGIKCTSDMTCDICKDWSVAQWEAFLKRRPYSGRRKHRPSPCVPDPSASSSLEAGCPAPTPQSLPLL